jgi:sugar O-acyltransferase (sialic acid O-acetyltransferase NeuD family)
MINMKKLLIIGAGGHAKVVADAVLSKNEFEIIGFADDNIKLGALVFGNYSIVSTLENISALSFDEFIVAIGNNEIRKEIFNSLSVKYKPAIIIHQNSIVSKYSKIGFGTVVLAGAVVSFGVEIGENCIINASSLIDHESIIATNCHIAQGVIIGSNCTVKELTNLELGKKINSHSKF